jgi:two-component system sensor histidine kinase YesM
MKAINIERNTKLEMRMTSIALAATQCLLLIWIAQVKNGKMLAVGVCIFAVWDVFLLLYYRRAVWKPLSVMKKRMKEFIRGAEFEEIFKDDYILTEEYPWMLEKLRHLINTQKVLELSIKQAHYLALQNQINPHFLYNTLDAIRTDALLAGVEPVANTTEALAAYFRYTVSNIDRFGTLSDELGNVKDYMMIQQYRFGDKLKLNVEKIDETILDCLLPRMTLQPLVENAIYHGLENKRKMGTVSISAHRTEKLLLITVSDDGIGMDRITVDRMNASLGRADSGYHSSENQKGGIAMKNIQSRIKLLFGEEYGLQVFSEKNVGTDVRIVLPLMTRKAEHAQGIHQD